MADKAIGELPKASAINDDSKLVMEQNGEAMHFEGKDIKDYVAPYSASAQNAAAAAQSAYAGVQTAMENIPAGAATPIVNDLTTGGTKMALSAEMGKLLAQRPNPNLLDNWYFADPINQRGVTGGIIANAYFIDRWKCMGAGSVSFDSGYMTIKTDQGYPVWLRQHFDQDFIFPLTASVLTSVGLLSATFTGAGAIEVDGGVQLRLTTERYIEVYIPTDLSLSIAAAKLEFGSVQTLIHQDVSGNWVLSDPPPNKALELEKCQYYYRIEHLLSRCIASNDGVAIFEVEKRMNMRSALSSSNITVMECTLHGVGALDPPGSVTAVWSGSSGTIRELYVANANIQVNTTYGLVLAIDCDL